MSQNNSPVEPISNRENRNPWIELARIIAMLMILTSHFSVSLNWSWKTQSEWTRSLVETITNFTGLGGSSLFFLITGYFLISKKFQLSRLIKLEIQTFCYTALILVVIILWGCIRGKTLSETFLSTGHGTIEGVLLSVFPILSGSYWFITAYAVLILFSPFINVIFSFMSKNSTKMFIALLTFLSLWPFITLFSGYWNDLWFAILSYCIGGWIRLHYKAIPSNRRGKKNATTIVLLGGASFLILLLLTAITNHNTLVVNLMQWNTKYWIAGGRWAIFPILSVTCFFLLLLRIQKILSSNIIKLINTTASSVFGIYLIHTNPLISSKLWDILNFLFQPPANTLLQFFLAPILIITVFVVYASVAHAYDFLIVKHIQKGVIKFLPFH